MVEGLSPFLFFRNLSQNQLNGPIPSSLASTIVEVYVLWGRSLSKLAKSFAFSTKVSGSILTLRPNPSLLSDLILSKNPTSLGVGGLV